MRRKIVTTTLATLLTTTVLSFGNEVSANEASKSESVIDIGKDAKIIKRSEDAYSEKLGITQNIQFDFIKDSTYNKDAIVIKTQGHIKPRSFFRARKHAHKGAEFIWPSQYNVQVKTTDPALNMIEFLPKNTTSSVNISETLGYGIGGNFKISEKQSGGIKAKGNYSKSISYSQENYLTDIPVQNGKEIRWNVTAHEFNINGTRYDARARDVFVSEFNYLDDIRKRFVDNSDLPALVTGGFSPSFITTLSRERNGAKTSRFEITYGRTLDLSISAYKTNPAHIVGAYPNRNFTATYEVNWDTHEVKRIDGK